MGWGEVQLSRKGIVNLEPDAEKRPLPPLVTRHDKREVVDEVRGVAMHQSSLAKGLQNERDVALLEIAHAAVDEFRGSRGSAFGEIFTLQQQGAVATARGIHGGTQARRATANDDDVPWRGIAQGFDEAVAREGKGGVWHGKGEAGLKSHYEGSSQARERPTALRQRARRVARSSALIAGSKVRSACHWLEICAVLSQNPTARPAR